MARRLATVVSALVVTLYVLACGLHPLGIGEPSVPAELDAPPAIAAESYDYRTNDLTSLTASVDPIDAQVQLAMTSIRNTGSANADIGQRFADVRKLTDDAAVVLEAEARTALDRLVRNRDIDIESIVVTTGEDWAEVTVNYINRRAADQQSRSFTRRF